MRWFVRVGIRSFRGVGLSDAVFEKLWCTIYWDLAYRIREVRIYTQLERLGTWVVFVVRFKRFFTG